MQTIHLISVIIPVYNAQNYLAQCLDSVLANTWDALEVLCVNDGSTDGSEAIVRDYAQKDPRVVLISQPNGGVSAARNTGLERAKGDCVAFVDADDFVAPDYFASLAGALTQADADLAVCDAFRGCDAFLNDARLAYEPGEPADYRGSSDRVLSDSQLMNYIWGRLYAVPFLNGQRYPVDLSLGEDTAFNILLFSRDELPKVVSTQKKMYFYRDSTPDSLTKRSIQTDVIRRAEWCLAQFPAANDRAKHIYLDFAFKSLWAYRYLTRYCGNDRQKIKAVRALCRQYARQLPLSRKTRLEYALFTNVPESYRLFRLLTDRTMIQWEREQKKAARERRASAKKQGDRHE